MRHLYSAALYMLLPFILLRMLWRSLWAPGYRHRLLERFGIFHAHFDSPLPSIWLHAVSLGEVMAAAPLIEDLLRLHPGNPLVVTTTTPTGSERVLALFGGRVVHVYAPWDLPGSVRRFLRRTRPGLLLIMETELWPNTLHISRSRGCRVLLANARLSQRSAAGYARISGLTRNMLEQLDRVACQSPEDGQRFLNLGLPPDALAVTGSIKFDLAPSDEVHEQAARLREDFAAQNRPVFIAASTHEGEETCLLEAFAVLKQKHADMLMVLVPRHPERFDAVYQLCTQAGWQVARRSLDTLPAGADDILLGDTMGELPLLYGAATLAFVGGSLVPRGGHNLLEPAVWGVPVLSGPHVLNFSAISAMLETAGALRFVANSQELARGVDELLAEEDKRRAMGAAALQVVARNRGARTRVIALVEELYRDAL